MSFMSSVRVDGSGRTDPRLRVFDRSGEVAPSGVDHLESMIDEPTTTFLAELDPRPGARCLDVGAGGGSITRWLADHVWPHGQVIAMDTSIDRLVDLDGRDGIEVVRHDIGNGIPVEGGFDLIHARLTLMHQPRREEILAELVDALAPGGWLMIGDFGSRHPEALSVPVPADVGVWNRIQRLTCGVAGACRGEDWDWAHEADGHLVSAGLQSVQGVEFSRVVRGGDPGCLLHFLVNHRLEAQLLEAGADPGDILRYRDLMLDSRFRAWFYQFVCTRGQKPFVERAA